MEVITMKSCYSPIQLSHIEQCDARGGLKILQVKQYFNFTVSPFTWTSLVRGGLRKLAELCVKSTLSGKWEVG